MRRMCERMIEGGGRGRVSTCGACWISGLVCPLAADKKVVKQVAAAANNTNLSLYAISTSLDGFRALGSSTSDFLFIEIRSRYK